ncbi:MAG TPA: glycosyltransferase family 87 protein [Anaerolineales bacterium]
MDSISPPFGSPLKRFRAHLLGLPLLTWVLVGFLITFLAFFIVPVFFDPSQVMQFSRYIRTMQPIGNDFRVTVSYASAWLHSGTLPPILYPPLTLVFFAPLALVSPDIGYRVVTLLILACYVLATFVLPQSLSRSKGLSAFSMLIFVTGLVSYGLQFELERGQWNLIAFTLSLVAVWLFHAHPKRRWLAYLFFTVAVQLKLYPAIFVLALVDRWSDWKRNLVQFAGLGLVNIAALFIFGFGPIQSMLSSQSSSHASHSAIPFNLSISSFVLYILSMHWLPHKRIILWVQANSWLPKLLLLGLFIACLIVVIWGALKRGREGFDPYVFMVCSIGALIIPSISYDYKLAFLPASVVLLEPAMLSFRPGGNRIGLILLTLLFSIAYSCTLYPEFSRPEWLRYLQPALLLVLLITSLWSVLGPGTPSEPLPEGAEAETGGPSAPLAPRAHTPRPFSLIRTWSEHQRIAPRPSL